MRAVETRPEQESELPAHDELRPQGSTAALDGGHDAATRIAAEASATLDPELVQLRGNSYIEHLLAEHELGEPPTFQALINHLYRESDDGTYDGAARVARSKHIPLGYLTRHRAQLLGSQPSEEATSSSGSPRFDLGAVQTNQDLINYLCTLGHGYQGAEAHARMLGTHMSELEGPDGKSRQLPISADVRQRARHAADGSSSSTLDQSVASESHAEPAHAPPARPRARPAMPGDAAVASLLESAEQHRRAGALETAVATVERAIRIQPRDPTVWHRLAALALEQKKYRLAHDVALKSNLLASGDPAVTQANAPIIEQAKALMDGELDKSEEVHGAVPPPKHGHPKPKSPDRPQ